MGRAGASGTRASNAGRVDPGDMLGVNVFVETQSPMRKISRLVLFLVIALVVGTAAFLATWDIPAPVTTIEKVIPDERFPR